MLRKRAFIIFMSLTLILTISMVAFIQSARFAKIVKILVEKNAPQNVGIHGDFDEFEVHFFPPGISITNPEIIVQEKNLINLPEGSKISAKSLDLRFYALQILTGNVRVHEAVINQGKVEIVLDLAQFETTETKDLGTFDVNWEELFQIRAEAVIFDRTEVAFRIKDPDIRAGFFTKHLQLKQWQGDGPQGYELQVDLENLGAELPTNWIIPKSIDQLQALIRINSEGIQIESISAKSLATVVQMAGTIEGDILKPKDKLQLTSDLSLSGDVQHILKTLKLDEESTKDIAGRVHFKGELKGNLLNFSKDFRANGTIEANALSYMKWKADDLKVSGEFESATGLIKVTDLVASQAPLPRSAGQPARGGELRVDPFSLSLTRLKPIKTEIHLKEAHFHWLAEPIIEDIFSLDFRASGSIGLEFDPGDKKKPWSLVATPDLLLPSLKLDNQKVDKVRALSHIINLTKEVSVAGETKVTADALTVNKLRIETGPLAFDGGGDVNFKEERLNLTAKGGGDLSHVETIAEIPIKGTTPLNVTIHGSLDDVLVDFDFDIQEANYLNLALGRVSGRVRWDDTPEDLIFSNIKGRFRDTHYNGGGKINFKIKDIIALDVKIPKGRIQDLNLMLDHLKKDFWWYPDSLTGALKGNLAIRGGTSLDELKIFAKLQGTKWNFYSESFRAIILDGGYDQGRYYISSFNSQKNRGYIKGNMDYSDKKGLSWKIGTSEFTLSDFNHISSLDVPLRGQVKVTSEGGTQKNKTTLSETKLVITQLGVRGRPYGTSNLTLSTRDGILKAVGMAHEGQAKVDLRYDLKPKSNSQLKASLNNFDFTPGLFFLNPSLIKDTSVEGVISGDLDIIFPSTQVELATGRANLTRYLLAKSNSRFELESPIRISSKSGTFNLNNLGVKNARGTTRVNLRSRRGAIEGGVAGKLDLTLAEYFTPTIISSNGVLDLNFTLGGRLKEPLIIGRSLLRDGELRVQGLETPVQNLRGTFQLAQGKLNLRNLRGNLGGGSVRSDGSIEFFSDRIPEIAVKTSFSKNRIRVYPFDELLISGTTHTKGSKLPYLVGGNITIDYGISREKVLDKKGTKTRLTAKYTPPPSTLRQSDFPFFEVDVALKADDQIFVKNDLFDCELKADLRLKGPLTNPNLLGTSEIVEGNLIFKDHAFNVDIGRVEFDRVTEINPKFNLNAQTQINNNKVFLFASGRALGDFDLELSSDPAMPENEILSLLIIGYTTGDLDSLNPEDRTAIQQGEAASLLFHSLGINRNVRKQTGFELDVEGTIDPDQQGSAFRRTPETEATSAGPKIVIKRKVGKKLEVSAGSSVGTGNSTQREVKSEYKVTPGMSVIGVYSTTDEEAETEETRSSYGLDVKFQKRFK